MKKYSLETKLAVVTAYLDGTESLRDTAKNYNVSKTMLHRWVAKFSKTWSRLLFKKHIQITQWSLKWTYLII